MSDLFSIAVVAAMAATIYELRWAFLAAAAVLAIFKAGQWLHEGWRETRDRKTRDRSAILARADRQHREVLAGDDRGIYGNSDTRIVFRDVARRISEETEGFTRPINRENALLPSGLPSNEPTTPPGYDDPYEVNSFGTEEPLRREFPIYRKPDWSDVVVVDLDKTDKIA